MLMGRTGKDRHPLARRHALLAIAITGTGLLWAATFAMAVNELGNERLHYTLLTGAFFAGIATMTLAKMIVNKRQVDQMGGDMRDAVHQAADELHTAVAEQGEVLRQDRRMIAAVRMLTAELVAARKATETQDHEA